MKLRSIFAFLFSIFFISNLIAKGINNMAATNIQTSPTIYQTWEIVGKKQLEEKISPFSLKEFSNILSREGIEVTTSKSEYFETAKKVDKYVSDIINPENHIIWEDSILKICIPTHPLVNHHIVIILKNDKKNLTELTEQEGLKLFETIQKIGYLLQKKFGFPGYVISRSNENPQVCHLIPPSHKNFMLRDSFEKSLRNRDTLFPNAPNGFEPKTTLTEVKITKLVSEWQTVFRSFKQEELEESKLEIQDPEKYCWTMITTNNGSAKIYLLESLFLALKNLGIAIQQKTYEPFNPNNAEIVTKHQGCVFCKESIISYQKCFEFNDILVLYNYTSPIKGYHFMVIPKRHVRNIELLTKAELKTIHSIETELIKILEEKFGHSNIKLFVQNGSPSVGQTVPHFHDKIVVTHKGNDNNEAVLYSLFSLQYIQGAPLKVSPEEMEDVKDEIGSALKLKFNK